MQTLVLLSILMLCTTPLLAQDAQRWRVMVKQKAGWAYLEETSTGTTLVDRQLELIDEAQELYATRKMEVLSSSDADGADIVYYDIQVSCLHQTYRIIEARGYDILDSYVYTKDDLADLGFMPLTALENEWYCNVVASEP